MENALIDTGVWYSVCDYRDERYNKNDARIKAESFDRYRLVLPWPTIYETLRTSFVRKQAALLRFEKLLKAPNIEYIDDESYHEKAFNLSLETSLRGGRPLSMVDCLLRLIIDDQKVKIKYLLTFNQKDFVDVCRRNRVVIL